MPLSGGRRALLGRLGRRRTRKREGRVLVEGRRAVAEALDAGAEPRFAVVSPGFAESPAGRALESRLRGADCDMVEVEDAVLDEVAHTERPQGVILVAEEPHAPELTALPSPGRYLILDGVQDPGNVGTLVRSAVAFALDGVVVLDGTADPWSPKAVRAAAGATFHLPVAAASGKEVPGWCRASGLSLVVAAGEGTDIAAWPEAPGWALVVGNEGAGVREALREAADATVRIPMENSLDSLNAGVAGSILLYAMTVTRE
ncbi:MAG: TrmH family RNA methyltransferase [Gemmatimonadota bacterium]